MSKHGEKLARWALLCALAWAVLAMHHIPSPATESAGTGHAMTTAAATAHVVAASKPELSDVSPAPMDLHSMLHLCMAVICVVGIAFALRLLRRVGAWTPGTRPRTIHRTVPTPARPPPQSGRDLLHSACVLRL